ncbi:MAG: phospholipase, partial [Actinomycetota bacterium]|nr:phospholipase [Actinomycetota bacterium]
GDYSAHHEPFQYYKSTSNPHHLPPTSVSEIGHDGQANHQYDLTDFSAALDAGKLPAVSFLKASKYQDGHAGYSDPLDEQHFLVNTINAVQKSKDWNSTAIVVAYDDSDGWYDHVAPTIINPSSSAANDAYTADGVCGHGQPLGGYQDRCGYGPRLPLLVISPYSRVNSVDSTMTDQSSVLRAIEDNWKTGRVADGSFDTLAGPLTNMFDFSKPRAKRLLLDPTTGAPVHGHR